MRENVSAFVKALLWGLLVILFPIVSGILAGILKTDKVQTLFLQGGMMVLALLPPLVLLLRRKRSLCALGFGKWNADGCKRAWFFLPLLLIFVPVTICGFYFKSTAYVLGNAFLYLFVGIAEEVYFRGIATSCLQKAFSQRGVIWLSSLVFALGHLATAFTGGGALSTALTVCNAFLFGWLAIEVTLLSGNILVPILLHFFFDFETKIIAMSGTGQLLAETVRGTLLFVFALWLAFVLKNRSKQRTPAAQAKRRKRKIRAAIIGGALVLLGGVGVLGISLYGQSQLEKIPSMSFRDCLTYTLADSADGVITVGILKDGQMRYAVYGTDGKELPQALHTYEIGSLTKTFTAALVQKAVTEGKIDLNDTVDAYLTLPAENRYPTIADLLTHTAGYRGYYLEAPMLGNFLAGRNDFCGVTDEMLTNKLETLDMQGDDYPFVYSNFGYAVLGQVLEAVYGEEYTVLVNRFAAENDLSATHISDGKGDLSDYWEWCDDDAYLPAGALTSNIEDMLHYAQLQLNGETVFADCHTVLREIDAVTARNALMDIRMDAIGMAWLTDEENGFIWHNGGTGDYNCYLGFCPENDTAVVILSNLAPSYRIPATVLGIKLLQEIKN